MPCDTYTSIPCTKLKCSYPFIEPFSWCAIDCNLVNINDEWNEYFFWKYSLNFQRKYAGLDMSRAYLCFAILFTFYEGTSTQRCNAKPHTCAMYGDKILLILFCYWCSLPGYKQPAIILFYKYICPTILTTYVKIFYLTLVCSSIICHGCIPINLHLHAINF